jgi:hypothetical protein
MRLVKNEKRMYSLCPNLLDVLAVYLCDYIHCMSHVSGQSRRSGSGSSLYLVDGYNIFCKETEGVCDLSVVTIVFIYSVYKN